LYLYIVYHLLNVFIRKIRGRMRVNYHILSSVLSLVIIIINSLSRQIWFYIHHRNQNIWLFGWLKNRLRSLELSMGLIENVAVIRLFINDHLMLQILCILSNDLAKVLMISIFLIDNFQTIVKLRLNSHRANLLARRYSYEGCVLYRLHFKWALPHSLD
jgi:hypothetical protein